MTTVADALTPTAMGQRLLGQRTRRLRHERGFTLQQLSDRSQMSVQYLSDVERGARLPSLTALYRIAGAMDLLVVDLIAVYPYATRRLPAESDVPSDT